MSSKINYKQAYQDQFSEWKNINRANFKLIRQKQKALMNLERLARSGALRKISKSQMRMFNRAINYLNG